MNTTTIQYRILEILRQFDNYDTYYYSESQRQISLIDDTAEDSQTLDIKYLPYTILRELFKEESFLIHLYVCPDNALVQFETFDTLVELGITQGETNTPGMVEYWD